MADKTMILATPVEVFIFSLIGGVVPALIWFLFWVREDRLRPEPRGLLAIAFLGGMIAVPLVIPFQKWTQVPTNETLTFFYWATLEEVFKFIVALIVVLRRKEDDEPIDPLIYMMTVALGFSAMENAIFLFSPLLHGNYTETLITGNIRFVGASLLHTIASAAIGVSLGLSFYKSKLAKVIALLIGIITAIALHTIFNLFIIKENSGVTFATLGFVWISVVILMLFFERVKRIYAVNKI